MEAHPNSPELVKHTLQLLELKPADILLDIGSGGLDAYIIALEKVWCKHMCSCRG